MAMVKLNPSQMKTQDEALAAAGYKRKYEGRGTWAYLNKEDVAIYKRTYIIKERIYEFVYPDPVK